MFREILCKSSMGVTCKTLAYWQYVEVMIGCPLTHHKNIFIKLEIRLQELKQ